MINCGGQAGAGWGGHELTPCTMAATPACQLGGDWGAGGGGGRARQTPRSWGNGPRKDKGQPGWM